MWYELGHVGAHEHLHSGDSRSNGSAGLGIGVGRARSDVGSALTYVSPVGNPCTRLTYLTARVYKETYTLPRARDNNDSYLRNTSKLCVSG